MVARLLSFLALVALLVMPLAPAQAAAGGSTNAAMAMNDDGHCGGAQGASEKAMPSNHCGAACALLLPGADHSVRRFRHARAAALPTAMASLEDRTPLLATPPPRRG